MASNTNSSKAVSALGYSGLAVIVAMGVLIYLLA